MKNEKKKSPRLPKVACNVVRETADGEWMAFQIYCGMLIPLLRTPARTMHEAFDRMYSEYYVGTHGKFQRLQPKQNWKKKK